MLLNTLMNARTTSLAGRGEASVLSRLRLVGTLVGVLGADLCGFGFGFLVVVAMVGVCSLVSGVCSLVSLWVSSVGVAMVGVGVLGVDMVLRRLKHTEAAGGGRRL